MQGTAPLLCEGAKGSERMQHGTDEHNLHVNDLIRYWRSWMKNSSSNKHQHLRKRTSLTVQAGKLW